MRLAEYADGHIEIIDWAERKRIEAAEAAAKPASAPALTLVPA